MSKEDEYKQALLNIAAVGSEPMYLVDSPWRKPTKAERINIMKNRGQLMMNIAHEALNE